MEEEEVARRLRDSRSDSPEWQREGNPRKKAVDPMSLMEPWMPERDPSESTQAYLTRLAREGKVTSELFMKIVNKINNK